MPTSPLVEMHVRERGRVLNSHITAPGFLAATDRRSARDMGIQDQSNGSPSLVTTGPEPN